MVVFRDTQLATVGALRSWRMSLRVEIPQVAVANAVAADVWLLSSRFEQMRSDEVFFFLSFFLSVKPLTTAVTAVADAIFRHCRGELTVLFVATGSSSVCLDIGPKLASQC